MAAAPFADGRYTRSSMFFRREKPQEWTFDSRLDSLKQAGFETARDKSGATRAMRKGFAATLQDAGGGAVQVGKAGVLMNDEIAVLVNGGYQMFLRTPSGKEFPAQAHQLKGLQAFTEDLREALGLTSLYNQSLGTVSQAHMYDRVEERDQQHHPRPWERKAAL